MFPLRRIEALADYQGEWEVIKVDLDSGAIDTVTPPSTAKHFAILETESSKRGLHYRAANVTKITNNGARNIQAISGDYNHMNSAYQIVQAGNKIILDGDYSFIVQQNDRRENDYPSE